MMKITILDDCIEDAELVSRLIKRYELLNHITVDLSYYSCFKQDIKQEADLIIMDIEMPGMNGIEAKEYLESTAQNVLIAFLTNYGNNVFDAFGVNVVGFFEKPLTYSQLEILLKKVENLKMMERKTELPNGRLINERDIQFISVKDVYSDIHMETETIINIRRSLREWESMLSDFCFFRINDACIVNMFNIQSIKNGRVVLKNGKDTLTISRRRKSNFEKEYIAFMRKISRYY